MAGLDDIVQDLSRRLDAKNQVRELALNRSRDLIRLCANSIRAVHRREHARARELLAQAAALASEMRHGTEGHPDVYFAGYTQDALKEFVEANITYAVIANEPIPTADDLQAEAPAYLNGLAESMGEMRRHVLDLIRADSLERAEQILAIMDEVYWLLAAVDFPAAITGDLRRSTDMVRGVLERTQSDLTSAQEQARMRKALRDFEARLDAPQA
jgi:translin